MENLTVNIELNEKTKVVQSEVQRLGSPASRCRKCKTPTPGQYFCMAGIYHARLCLAHMNEIERSLTLSETFREMMWTGAQLKLIPSEEMADKYILARNKLQGKLAAWLGD